MGHNPTKNPFRRARLGLDASSQAAVDEYKARSVWSVWWQLDERIRRRYFTADERRLVTRYGARLDDLASFRDLPRTERETQFVRVCTGEREPESATERLWLFVQLVCRYEASVRRAAEADLARNDAMALRSENEALKARCDHLELYAMRLEREAASAPRPICNVVWRTSAFIRPEICGPQQAFRVITESNRGIPIGMLMAEGLVARSPIAG